MAMQNTNVIVPVSSITNAMLTGNGTTPCVPDDELGPEDQLFWIYLSIIVSLVIFAGMMSGLTLGLLSLDIMSLRVLVEAGTDRDQKYARRILPLVKRHHLLLVTLLLANAAAAEALPIFLDRISNPITAVVISVTAVLIFGEVIPQALCSRHGLAIGAVFSPLVYFLMFFLVPVGYPVSKLLDWLLGSEHKTFFRRAELKALVALHGPSVSDVNRIQSIVESIDTAERIHRQRLNPPGSDSQTQHLTGNEDPLSYDEVLIIKGALEMRDKSAADALVPIEHTFMLDVDRVLDDATLAEIEHSHHSRIPLYDQNRNNIIGCLLVRGLIRLNAADKVPIRRILATRAFRQLLHVDHKMPLYELLSELKTGRSNMAIIHEADEKELLVNQAAQEAVFEASQISSSPMTAGLKVKRRAFFKLAPNTTSPVLGIVSLEDVIEELLQEEILDEMDFDVAHSLHVKNVTDACRETMSALSTTVNQIRRLRHAGMSLASRDYTMPSSSSSGAGPMSVSRSLSSNILLARSRTYSNRITRRMLSPHAESYADEEADEEGMLPPHSYRNGGFDHHVQFDNSVVAGADGERNEIERTVPRADGAQDAEKERWFFSS